MTQHSQTTEDAVQAIYPDLEADPPEDVSLVTEFVWFLRENKKWWLIPLILLILALGLIVLLAGKASVLAPFIYPLA